MWVLILEKLLRSIIHFGEYNYETSRVTCHLLGLMGKEMDTSSALVTIQELLETVSVTTIEWDSAQLTKIMTKVLEIVQKIGKEAGGTTSKQHKIKITIMLHFYLIVVITPISMA